MVFGYRKRPNFYQPQMQKSTTLTHGVGYTYSRLWVLGRTSIPVSYDLCLFLFGIRGFKNRTKPNEYELGKKYGNFK